MTVTPPRTPPADAGRSAERPSPVDRARQVTVTAAEIFCVIGTLVGVGVLGTPVASSSGGALSADATLLAPAGTAFSIWSVIYVGLAAYTLLQWLPGQATSARDRSIGWLVAASMVLNAGWLLVTQQGWIEVSVVVIVALLGVLVAVVRRLDRLPGNGAVDLVVRDGTFGLYLGWVAVATFANVAATFAASSLAAPEPVVVAGALVGLVAVVGLHVGLARVVGPRWTVVGATAWGLAWVTVGRLTDQPESLLVGVAAAVAAAAVLAVAFTGRRGPAARA